MNIFINGKVSEVKKNINIQDILRMNNISDENIVVEINRTIISKMYWDDTRIEENDKIEIITAVEENIDQTQCGGSMDCKKDKPCSTHDIWTGLNKIIIDYMKNITIGDVVSKNIVHNLHDAREESANVN